MRVTLPNTYRASAASCPDSVTSVCYAPFLRLAFEVCGGRGGARSEKGGEPSGVTVAVGMNMHSRVTQTRLGNGALVAE